MARIRAGFVFLALSLSIGVPATTGAGSEKSMLKRLRSILTTTRRQGVIADWDTLIPALRKSFKDLVVTSQPPSSTFSRCWLISVNLQEFRLEITIYPSVDEVRNTVHVTNLGGGVLSRDPLGDSMAEIGLDRDTEGYTPPGLVWTFRNLCVTLNRLPSGEWRSYPRENRQILLGLGAATQRFLVEHQVDDLAKFTPLVEIENPFPQRMALGSTLSVRLRTRQLTDLEFSLDARMPELSWRAPAPGQHELLVTAGHVGKLVIYCTIRNQKTALGSTPIQAVIQVLHAMDKEPHQTVSSNLVDRCIQEGDPLKVVNRPQDQHATRVVVITVGERRWLLLQLQTLVNSNAPAGMVTDLQKVFLLAPPKKPVRLDPTHFKLDFGWSVDVSGQFVLDGEDWVITPAPASLGSTALEALKQAGVVEG